MRLSLRAIELCRTKLGKGMFHGFQEIDTSILNEISEESAERDFDELIQSGIITFSQGDVHISPLGQHIFRMMLKPEQYIMADYAKNNICVRIYIRDAYYLCVMEDKSVKAYDDYSRFTLKLLPRLELVIGSVAYVLLGDKGYDSVETLGGQQSDTDVQIIGKAWDQNQEEFSKFAVSGSYYNEKIQCRTTNEAGGFDEAEYEPHELINKITEWILANISAGYQSDE